VRTRVTTANIASTLPDAAIRADFAAAAAGTDILCTQEDHQRDSAKYLPAGWATVQFKGGSKGRCAIHYRTALFAEISRRSLLLNLANGLTFPGARRDAVVVRLQDKRNGKIVKVTSAHFVPHADDDENPGVLTPMPRGVKAVIPAIASLADDSETDPADVEVIGADVNDDIDRDLAIHDNGMLERFNAAGFRSDVQQLGATPDTHGTNEYDWLLVKGAGKWVGHETRAKKHSDHRAKTAVAEY